MNTCCNTTLSEAFYGGNYRGDIEPLAPYCWAGCVSVCLHTTYHSVHCCIGSPNTTMPPTPEPTTPAPATPSTTTKPTTTTTPEPCTDCTCMPVWYARYGSRKVSKPKYHYCCSRSDSSEIYPRFRGTIDDYSYYCSTMCVATCGDKYHCCEGIPTRTKAPGASSSSSCFPSSASVNLQNGKSVTMSDLQIGDKVQTGTCICFICPLNLW